MSKMSSISNILCAVLWLVAALSYVKYSVGAWSSEFDEYSKYERPELMSAVGQRTQRSLVHDDARYESLVEARNLGANVPVFPNPISIKKQKRNSLLSEDAYWENTFALGLHRFFGGLRVNNESLPNNDWNSASVYSQMRQLNNSYFNTSRHLYIVKLETEYNTLSAKTQTGTFFNIPATQKLTSDKLQVNLTLQNRDYIEKRENTLKTEKDLATASVNDIQDKLEALSVNITSVEEKYNDCVMSQGGSSCQTLRTQKYTLEKQRLDLIDQLHIAERALQITTRQYASFEEKQDADVRRMEEIKILLNVSDNQLNVSQIASELLANYTNLTSMPRDPLADFGLDNGFEISAMEQSIMDPPNPVNLSGFQTDYDDDSGYGNQDYSIPNKLGVKDQEAAAQKTYGYVAKVTGYTKDILNYVSQTEKLIQVSEELMGALDSFSELLGPIGAAMMAVDMLFFICSFFGPPAENEDAKYSRMMDRKIEGAALKEISDQLAALRSEMQTNKYYVTADEMGSFALTVGLLEAKAYSASFNATGQQCAIASTKLRLVDGEISMSKSMNVCSLRKKRAELQKYSGLMLTKMEHQMFQYLYETSYAFDCYLDPFFPVVGRMRIGFGSEEPVEVKHLGCIGGWCADDLSVQLDSQISKMQQYAWFSAFPPGKGGYCEYRKVNKFADTPYNIVDFTYSAPGCDKPKSFMKELHWDVSRAQDERFVDFKDSSNNPIELVRDDYGMNFSHTLPCSNTLAYQKFYPENMTVVVVSGEHKWKTYYNITRYRTYCNSDVKLFYWGF